VDITHYDEFQEAKGHLLGVDISPEEYMFASKTAIFYVNNNNGGTRFEDDTFVESVRNRALLFTGKIAHETVTQTDTNFRFNININYNSSGV